MKKKDSLQFYGISYLLSVKPIRIQGSNQAPPPLSVTGQPLDGAQALVYGLHVRFHSISSGYLRLTTLSLSRWGPVDCNFSDGIGILVQHMPNPLPWLPGDDGLHILFLALC